jgi:DNA-directed RNA polymerase specialized sigma subunit
MNKTEGQTIAIVEAFFSPAAAERLHRHEIDSVQTALAALLEYQPQVLEFYYRQKLSFPQIALRLELNPVTISGLHNRGITRLTKLLKEMAVLGKRGRPNSIGKQIPNSPTQQMLNKSAIISR